MYRPDGKTIGHAEIKIGDSIIMLADEMPQARMLSPQSVGGTPFQLYMYVKDVDKVFNQAIKAGATVTEPVMDTFYGDPQVSYWILLGTYGALQLICATLRQKR
jgi:PhnB protein